MQQVLRDQISANQESVPFELIALLHRQMIDFAGIWLERVSVLSRPVVCGVDLQGEWIVVVVYDWETLELLKHKTDDSQLTSKSSVKFCDITSDTMPLWRNC